MKVGDGVAVTVGVGDRRGVRVGLGVEVGFRVFVASGAAKTTLGLSALSPS